MNKLLIAAVAVSMMAVSSWAVTGKVARITVKTSGASEVMLNKDGGGTIKKNVDPTSAEGKAILANALTAQTTGNPVEAYHDGTNWTVFSVSIPTP